MQEWLRNQEWSAELWVAALVLAVVLVNAARWGYDHYLKH